MFTNDTNYLTQETDPIFSSWNKSTGITITEAQITNLQSYLTSIAGLNISLLTNDSNYITDGNTNWDNSYNFITASSSDTLTNKAGNISMWTNNSGYLTSYTETDPIFSAWNKSTGITITESQISDLQTYLTDLSTLTTDNLTQGTTNKYSQWTTNTTNLSYTTGNVGIGTTTPTEKLEVAGNIKSSNYIGSGNRCVYVDLNGVLRVKSEDCGTSSGGDNLGNHTLTQNMILGSNWISGDGDNEGFQISSTGILSGAQGNISMWTNNSGYITDGNTNWDNSYGFLTSYTETDPVFSAWDKSIGISITESQISNLQSYLTSYTETDPVFLASQAHNITASHLTILGNTSNTNTGDETQSSIQTKLGTATTTTNGYLTSTDWNIFNNKQPAGSYLTGTKVDSFNTRTGAVTLSSSDVTTALTFTPYNATNPAGYISSYTETDPVFSAWNKSTGISITESQISDLQTYLTNLSSLTTDNLTQGTTNLYSQWATSGSNISFSGGNVGIGTTSPGAKLDVRGAGISDDTDLLIIDAGGFGAIDADARFKWKNSATDLGYIGVGLQTGVNDSYMAFGLNNSGLAEKMRITKDGNIGIGTTAPGYALDVNGAMRVKQYLYLASSESPTANDWHLRAVRGSGLEFVESDVAGGRLYLQEGGNVGIGTTGPTAKLNILNSANANGLYLQQAGNTADNDDSGVLYVLNQGMGPALNIRQNVAGTSTSVAQILVENTSTSGIGLWVRNHGAGSSFRVDDVYSDTTPFLIDNSGNVGIGTTAPTGKLHIVQATGVATINQTYSVANFENTYGPGGDSLITLTGSMSGHIAAMTSTQAAIPLKFYTGATERMQITATGNVGIGTTGPGDKLQIGITNAGSVNEGLSLQRAGGAGSKFAMKLKSDAGGYYRGALEFTQNGGSAVEVMSFAPETGDIGNVGIGTTSPESKLHVSSGDNSFMILGPNATYSAKLRVGNYTGSLPADTAQVAVSNGNIHIDSRPGSSYHSFVNYFSSGHVLFVRGGGNVGINNETPGRKLFVSGDAGGTTGWYNDSDQRLKTNIATLTNPLEKILSLRGVNFSWIDPTRPSGNHLGFIAQEMLPIVPELVNLGGDYYGVDYAGLTPLLVEGIKELNLKKADLSLLITNQTAIDQNFTLLGERITTLENWIPVFTGMTEEWIPAFARMTEKQTGMTEDIDTIKTNLSQLTLDTQQLTTDYTNLELRVLEIETTLAGIETGFELPVEMQTLQQALLENKIEFDADGNLKVKKLETDRLKVNGENERPACDAFNAGEIFFDKTSEHFYGCNGKIWKELDTVTEEVLETP